MKRFIAAILVISMMSSFAIFTEAKKIEVDDSTIIYLDFDGKLPEGVEASGNFTYTEGVDSQAALFDGEETYIKLPDNITKGVNDFTISMWIRFDAIRADVWQRIFDFGGNGDTSMYFGMWQYLKSNNVRTGIGGETVSEYGNLNVGEWVHYAIVQKGDSRSLYVNGCKAGESSAEKTLDSLGDTVGNYIGKWNKNTEPTEYFHGAMDDFLFTTKSLSEVEIKAIAFEHLNDSAKLKSLTEGVYINLNEAGDGFDYFTFNDGTSFVEWTSTKPEILTVEGIKTDKISQVEEVTLTANITAGNEKNQISYTYVVCENEEGKLEITIDTLEKIEIREIRRTKAAEVDTTKYYLIKKKGENKYLSVKDDALTLKNKATDASSVWRFTQAPKEKVYTISSVESGKCLDVTDWNKEKGAKVGLYKGGKGTNQNFYIINNENGLGILSYLSELFLTDEFTLDGLNNLTDWELIETNNPKEQMGKVITKDVSRYADMYTGKYYTIKAKGQYLSDQNGLTLVRKAETDNEKWAVVPVSDQLYVISNKATGKNLNVLNHNKNAGARIITYQPVATDNEYWRFIKRGSFYNIVGKSNKNYMSIDAEGVFMSAEPLDWWFEKTDEAAPLVEAKEEEAQVKDRNWAMALITDYVPKISEEVDAETGFIHPGVSMTKTEIERFQRHIRAGDDPWYSGFANLASQSQSSKTCGIQAFHSDGDTTKLIVEPRLKNMRYDATTAANQALMYVITGDVVYRENTMKIIRKWYHLRDAYTSLGSDWIDHGVIAYKLTVAAELMKYSGCENEELLWTDEDNEMFIGMLEATEDKYDRYWLWMNQLSICNQGMMASAIFRNDMEDYKIAVQRTSTNPEDGGSKYTMTGSGGAITQVFRIVDYDAWNGDKIEPAFVHAEMGRDQGHAYGDVSALATCAMMTYLQGTKVDPETGEMTDEENGVDMFEFADDRLLAGGNYISKYNLGYNVDHPSIDVGNIYTDINDTNRGHYYPITGILYNYYKYVAKMDMNDERIKYLYKMHTRNFPEPSYSDNLGLGDMLYAPDEAKIDHPMVTNISDGTTASLLQVEKYTALLKGQLEEKKSDDVVYLTVTPQDGRAQFAYADGWYPPAERRVVRLRVRTQSTVKVTLQNEHLVYAPFVYGVIPNTKGKWKTIEFEVESTGHFGQRLYFFTFDTDKAFDIDYAEFKE